MDAPLTARILLCADANHAAEDVRQCLTTSGCAVHCHALGDNDPHNGSTPDLFVVDGAHNAREGLQLCRRLRSNLGECFVPILFVTADHSPGARLASLEAGADTYLLRPFEPAELLAQVRALVRIKESHDRLTDKTAEVHRINKRLQLAYHQIDLELDLAQRIQQSFLPQTLPEVPQARFAVHYQPCGRVGGDFYDVFRLDEKHLGFYVADAMGHGVPASLLTIFVKKGVKAKEIFGQQYRLVPPSEVLQKLNQDMIDQQLSELPFITMVYVLLNFREGLLQFSRAGHPYPVYLPRDGEPRQWQIEGGLLGVFPTKYPMQTHHLNPGDKVLLYTDGMDSANFEEQSSGHPSVLACASKYRDLPIEELVATLSRVLFQKAPQKDDLTLLGVEMT